MFWRKLSLGSPFNDLPGALSSSSGLVPVFTAHQQDNVYHLQSHEPRPWLLIPSIFYNGQLVDTNWQSQKVYEQLVHMQLLSPEGEVNTEPVERKNFGKEIMSKLAFIPQIKIKMVIDFLFWWAEETQRLKKLVAEKEELEGVIKVTPDATDASGITAKLLLDRAKARIMTLPSNRANGEDERPVQLSSNQVASTEQPPAYQ